MSLAPWIIRTGDGPQPEVKAACALHVEPPQAGGSTHGWCQAQVHLPGPAGAAGPCHSTGLLGAYQTRVGL